MRVTATAGSSHFASSAASSSDIAPRYCSLTLLSRKSNAVAKCLAATCRWNSIDAESGWTCTVVRMLPSSSRNRWNAIIRGSFVSTKSTSSARFLRASSSFPGLIFAVPTYTNAPDIASSLLSQAALPSDGAGAAAHSRAGPFDEILNRTANVSLKGRRYQRTTAEWYRRPASPGDRMDFRILGSTEVLDGTRRIELPAGRGRALLALLILHAGEPVAAERIVDELWGEDPPRTAGTVVQELVSRLRRAFPPGRAKGSPTELLQTVGKGYRLAADPESIDANRFKRFLDEARRASPWERSA